MLTDRLISCCFVALQSPQINPNNPLTATEALLANMSESNYSKEIEDEVEKCIQRVFKPNLPNSLSVDEFVEILGKFKDSPEKKEKVSRRRDAPLFTPFSF